MRKLSSGILCLALIVFAASAVFAAGEPIAVPKAGTVVIDGDITEWAGAPAYWLSSAWVADATDVSGNDDLSAFGMFSYDADNLYMAFRVIDDVIVMERNDSNVWQTDCVEVWIGGMQYGLTLADGKAPFVQDWKYNGTDGVKVAVVKAASGYVVEASFPAAIVKKATGKELASGNSFPLAFGVDDADQTGGSRIAQLYLPKGWVHSSPDSFSTAILQ